MTSVAFVPFEDLYPDGAFRAGVQWLGDQEGSPLLLLDQLSVYNQNRVWQERARDITVASLRTLSRSEWQGGPVVAAWPSEDLLQRVSRELSFGRATAVCVLMYGDAAYQDAWLQANNARHAETGAPYEGTAWALPPVVERAVGWIADTVNKSTGFSHPSDHDKAVLVLEQLRLRGHTFDVQALYARALVHGLQPKSARELSDLGDRLAKGRPSRVSNRGLLRSDLVQRWEAEINGG
ncbi:hypothetical protein OG426_56135 (plasmid) [Streptomyces canus]|uniref:hypothetical protein n=1 Tax=Streptomyces canus TaxID=58343 RepID=UPI002F90CDC8|nr:hypothetical protein OG426_56135 [Streptomyces canus]